MKRVIFVIPGLILTFIIEIIHTISGPAWSADNSGLPLPFMTNPGLISFGGEQRISNLFFLVIDIIFWTVISYLVYQLIRNTVVKNFKKRN